MNTFSWIFLGLFVAVSIVQLVFCFLEKEKLRKITKPFCVFVLGLFALVTLPDQPLIYVGAFLGAIGDILLIKNKDLKLFLIGVAVFVAGHICYLIKIISMTSYGANIPFWTYILIGVALVGLAFAMYPLDKKLAGKATLVGNFYMPFLGVIVVFGFMLTADRGWAIQPMLIPIGYIFFLISDCILTFTTYVKDIKRRDFPIMLTYLIAEFCIVFGLLLTKLNG